MNRLLGFYLRGLRCRDKETLQVVAQKLGLSNPVFLSSIESGRQAIPIPRIHDFRKAYGADSLFFPRAVLLLWYGEVWNLFKNIIYHDKTWTYSEDEDSWYRKLADAEIRYFLVNECKEMLDHYRPKDRTALLTVLREYHDTPCVEPPLPLDEQPSYLEQYKAVQDNFDFQKATLEAKEKDFLKHVKEYIRRHGKNGLRVPKWLRD